MAEVFVEFAEPVIAKDGTACMARAVGGEMDNGHWQGWIEFIPVDGGEPLRSGRETTQPNRQDAEYWATGLTPVYLEGALERALNPVVRTTATPAPEPIFDAPADNRAAAPTRESVLNPFSVYRKGEDLLRRQLSAMSAWHLLNIIDAYGLSNQSAADLAATPEGVLVELIVAAVRERATEVGSTK